MRLRLCLRRHLPDLPLRFSLIPTTSALFSLSFLCEAPLLVNTNATDVADAVIVAS